MKIIKAILTNGFILLIPILIWNILFSSKLHTALYPKNMDIDIPSYISIGENIFRMMVFMIPFFLIIDLSTQVGKVGLGIYTIGCLIYFASWLLLIYAPESLWSNSILGFSAPAFLPAIWFVGISLMSSSYNIKIHYARWHYLVPCFIFLAFHITTSILSYLGTN